MSDQSPESANPFSDFYDPEDGLVGPVAPPTQSSGLPPVSPVGGAPVGGLPVGPATGGMPVAPISGGMPVAPVPTAGLPVTPGASTAPVPPPYTDAPTPQTPQGPQATVPAPLPVPTPHATAAPTPVPAPVPAPVTPPAPVPGAGSTPGLAPQRRNPNAPVMPNAASTPGVALVETEEADEKITLDDLLIHMVEQGGSDLHLSAGSPPVIRVRGEMQPVPGYGPMTPKQLQDGLYSVMTGKQRAVYEEKFELDFAYTVPGQARFRVNVMKQRGSIGAVMRAIPWEILSLDMLGLPETIGGFADLPRGMVLVTGPTGSGKSTTLAAIIDKINRTRAGHIITIEDPVEFLHQHRKCVVNQREVGEDTHSFQDALKHVLRQDPDVILVGEMRDLETISVALSAAETGHLVFATLHTQSAQETITRIVDVFPANQQQQVRTQLAASLQGVVCQTLCKTADGNGRQAAVEIMVATPQIRALIRDDKLQQVQGALQTGGQHGMQTLNQDLANHVKAGRITYEQGLEKCSDKEDFNTLVGGREAAEKATRQAAAARQAQQGMDMGMGMYAPPPVG